MNIHFLQYDMSDSSILCNITRYSYTIRLSNYTSFHFVISGMGRPITKVVSKILCNPIHIIDVCVMFRIMQKIRFFRTMTLNYTVLCICLLYHFGS